MMRLRTWMRDALTGGLMIDGWEPVPLAVGMTVRLGYLDGRAFQELAAARRDGGVATGAALIIPLGAEYALHVINGEISADTPPHSSALAKAALAAMENKRLTIPWVFVWSTAEKPVAEPVFGCWPTYKDLLAGLMRVGLAEPLQRSIGAVLANGCDCKHFPGQMTLVVLIGVWRPVPIADNIYGLSDDREARQLEIRALSLEAEVTGNLLDNSTKLRAVISNPLPEPALFRWTAGVEGLATPALLGNGALGSAIADHLLRCGIEEMTVLDKDILMPHNLARHSGDKADLHRPKINHVERSAARLSVENRQAKIRACLEDICALSRSELIEQLEGTALIIDATAEERVRASLTSFGKGDARLVIVRTEIYHRRPARGTIRRRDVRQSKPSRPLLPPVS